MREREKYKSRGGKERDENREGVGEELWKCQGGERERRRGREGKERR